MKNYTLKVDALYFYYLLEIIFTLFSFHVHETTNHGFPFETPLHGYLIFIYLHNKNVVRNNFIEDELKLENN
jgi:hypothetical protein